MEKNFDYDVYSLDSYDYKLDESLIAQDPYEKRDEARLLVFDKKTGEYEDRYFYDIVDYLKQGDVLVRNNTKVIPARLFGEKVETHAKVEVLLLHEIENMPDCWECLCGNAKVIKVGTVIKFNDKLSAQCIKVEDEGLRIMKMEYKGIFLEILSEIGLMPLPPYIHKQTSNNDNYQTVYAKIDGSAAAPTAGFHFTNELFEKIKAKGVIVCDVTLHVGLGTFRPVKESNILNHKMHTEKYFVSGQTADILNKAKENGNRIIAIGTTTIRTLETVMSEHDKFVECSGDTSIFIYPGFKFKAVDCLVTNFHLPKSTLMMLVSAFSTRDNIISAYNHAVKEKYKFFSFGDAMFIKE